MMGSSAPGVKYTLEGMVPTPDPSRCPLCGTPNGCALVAGSDTEACWCASVELSSEVLGRIPQAARDKACVCAACAKGEASRGGTARALRTIAR
jgi:hypothetical protein